MSEPTGNILDKFSLKGKTVLVTGATGGIGHHLTLAVAEAGAEIISLEMPDDPLSDNLKQALENMGRKYQVFFCNLSDIRSIKASMESIWASGLEPDILLNIAGIQCFRTIEDHTPEHLDLVCTHLYLRSSANSVCLH